MGTVTEIYDYLRLLYARIGVPHCPVCGKEIRRQSVDQIVNRILALPADSRLLVLAPMVRAKKGMHEKVLDSARISGFVRVRADGAMYDPSRLPLIKTCAMISILLLTASFCAPTATGKSFPPA